MILVVHFKQRMARPLSLYFNAVSCMVTSVAAIIVMMSLRRDEIPLSSIVTFLLFYGAALFVVLSDFLIAGFAAHLTRVRGEKWIKEIDYIYLTLGMLGIIGALNRVTFVRDRFEGTDLIAPLLLITAVVIRIVKTRAEIGGWNKV